MGHIGQMGHLGQMDKLGLIRFVRWVRWVRLFRWVDGMPVAYVESLKIILFYSTKLHERVVGGGGGWWLVFVNFKDWSEPIKKVT